MLSIYRKILFLTVALTSVILTVSTLLNVRVVQDVIDMEMTKRAQTLMRSLGGKCKYAVTILDASACEQYIDRKSLDDFIEDIRQNESDVIKIQVINREGMVLSSLDGRERDTLVKEFSLENRKLGYGKTIQEHDEHSGDIIVISDIPIQDISWGTAIIRFSSSSMDREKRRIALQSTLAGIAFLIVGVAICIPLVGTIVKPIRKLNAYAEAIGRGNLDVEIDVRSRDEVGQLANTFSSMASRLKQTLADLEQRLADLKRSEESLRESENKYRNIFENAVEGIFQMAPDGSLINANRAMAALLGYDCARNLPSSITDRSMGIFVSSEDCDRFTGILKSESKVVEFETRVYQRDRSIMTVSLSARAAIDAHGTLLHYEGAMVDITERKMREKAERDREAAEAAAKAKGEFLARMSHEIRTPMNAIIGLSNLALRREIDSKQRDYLTKISLAAHSLLGIINDILDFSKIEADKMEIEAVNFTLPYILEEQTSLFYFRTVEKGIEMAISIDEDVPWRLVGDPLRLGQILNNLIGNAVKFTEHGQIVIGVSLVEKGNERVRLQFSVSDSGIGIPKDRLCTLFESFTQADNSHARKYGGSGLGLSICKRLAELMHGRIWVEIQAGEGSTFIFEAELGLRPDAENQKPVLPVDIRGLTVLVADDNEISLKILESMLTSFSFRVTTVTSGEDVIEMLDRGFETATFDLLITDCCMKELDGIETCRRIRENSRMAQVPIIMISAHDRDGLLSIQAEKLGVDAFIKKPVSPSTLFDTIMDLFGKEVNDGSRQRNRVVQETEVLKATRGARLLLAEDNEINQQVAVELLESAGLSVTVADNGRMALDIMNRSGSEHGFDAVLMDLQMPEMDGYETTRRIREDPRFKDLPVIALTAYAFVGEREECLKAGMNDHVAKPINPQQLFDTLARWIKPGERREAPQPGRAPRKDDTELPEHLPGIDIGEGLRRVGGNKTLYKDLLKAFARKNTDTPNAIVALFEEGDALSAGRLVHTLRGVSGNIGAAGVFHAASELEPILCRGGRKTCRGPLERLLEETKLVIESIESWIADEKEQGQTSDAPGASLSLDVSRLEPAMSELAELLRDSDSEAIDQVEVLKFLFGSEGGDELDRMEALVGEERYDQALEMLEGLAGRLGISM